MTTFHSAAVPFIQFGNRRGLSDEQLANDLNLAAFVRRFRASFEYDTGRCVWMFIEPAK